jgi:Cu/Zn superoxide dismutase
MKRRFSCQRAFVFSQQAFCGPPQGLASLRMRISSTHRDRKSVAHSYIHPAAAGDLLMLKVGADGTGKASLLDPNATLGDGPNSIFHDGGTSLVIHADPDDYKTDPAGNSGARIACGVIEK